MQRTKFAAGAADQTSNGLGSRISISRTCQRFGGMVLRMKLLVGPGVQRWQGGSNRCRQETQSACLRQKQQ